MMSKHDRDHRRVLMLVQNCSYPEDCRVLHEANSLRDQGYEVTAISPAPQNESGWSRIDLNGVPSYFFPPPRHSFTQAGYIWEYAYTTVAMFVLSLVVLFRHGFDVIHAANPSDTLFVIAAFYKLLGKRFIFDHHDLAPEMYMARFPMGSKLMYRVLLVCERLSCRLANHVITTNESYKQVDVNRSHLPPDRVSVVRNGPDLRTFDLSTPDPALRSKAKHIIGYGGVMGIQDGIDTLIRALHHLVSHVRRTDFLCVLVGDGDACNDLKALASELHLDDYVWFTGWVGRKEYARYLASADICVCPDPPNEYNDRSTLVKIMEYMALRKPVVAFDLTENRFSAQDAAIYVRDEKEFAQALATLMDDPVRRASMGEIGRRRIERELAWDYSVTPLLGAYNKAMAERRVGAAVRRRIHGIKQWAGVRKPGYVWFRFRSIVNRYGVGPHAAKKRAVNCVATLGRHGCRPTFAVPGRVVSHHPGFFRELQDMGAELALHGYDHIDFRSLTAEQAARQIALAQQAFQNAGLRFEGIRCPYLSGTPELHRSLPSALRYSSNGSVWWEGLHARWGSNGRRAEFDCLLQFYRPDLSSERLAVPRIVDGKLDIPASVPDDIQLCDGLNLSPAELTEVWSEVLFQTYRRGEVFVVLFHPELYDRCEPTLATLLDRCHAFTPPVWVAPLRDISDWWWEKSQFRATLSSGNTSIQLRASERATILARNLPGIEPSRPWDGRYRILETRTFDFSPGSPLPLISLGLDVDSGVRSFLEQQGYILAPADADSVCSVRLEADAIRNLSELEMIERLESSDAPLVRFSRWPHGTKSAFSITGDLDALSLRDYLSRIVAA